MWITSYLNVEIKVIGKYFMKGSLGISVTVV